MHPEKFIIKRSWWLTSATAVTLTTLSLAMTTAQADNTTPTAASSQSTVVTEQPADAATPIVTLTNDKEVTSVTDESVLTEVVAPEEVPTTEVVTDSQIVTDNAANNDFDDKTYANEATTDETSNMAESTPEQADTSNPNQPVDENLEVPAENPETPQTSAPEQVTATPQGQVMAEPEKLVEMQPLKAEPRKVKKNVTPVSNPVKRSNQKTETAIDTWMPNKVLQELVLKALQNSEHHQASGKTWNSVADITQEDMLLVEKIFGNNKTFIDGKRDFSLEGLQYAKNLKVLRLEAGLNMDPANGQVYGDITDISQLAGLNLLEDVWLQHNRIKDVTPLQNKSHLKSLNLAYNAILDFSPLSYLQGTMEYGDYSYVGQFIALPKKQIQKGQNSAHMQVAATLLDGTVVQLTAKGKTALVPWGFDIHTNKTIYHVYVIGGDSVSDGHGGLNYTNLVPQHAGPTGAGDLQIDPLEDMYYMVGQYGAEGGAPTFTVVQSYDFADEGAPVTVHYQTADGTTVAPDKVVDGLVGDDFTTEAAKVPGYTLVSKPDKESGKFTDKPQDFTYVYEKDVTEGASVTVHYQTADGTTVAPNKVLTGNVDDDFTTEAVKVPGYTLVNKPDKESGKFTDKPQDFTYVYEQDSNDTGSGDGNGGGATTPGDGNNGGGATTPGDGNNSGGATTPGDGNNSGGATTPGDGNNSGGATTPGNGNNGGGPTTPGNGNNNGSTVTTPGTGNTDDGPNGDVIVVTPNKPNKPNKPEEPSKPSQSVGSGVTTSGQADAPVAQTLASGSATESDHPAEGISVGPATSAVASPATPAPTGTLPQTGEERGQQGIILGSLTLLVSLLGFGWLKRRRQRHED